MVPCDSTHMAQVVEWQYKLWRNLRNMTCSVNISNFTIGWNVGQTNQWKFECVTNHGDEWTVQIWPFGKREKLTAIGRKSFRFVQTENLLFIFIIISGTLLAICSTEHVTEPSNESFWNSCAAKIKSLPRALSLSLSSSTYMKNDALFLHE